MIWQELNLVWSRSQEEVGRNSEGTAGARSETARLWDGDQREQRLPGTVRKSITVLGRWMKKIRKKQSPLCGAIPPTLFRGIDF